MLNFSTKKIFLGSILINIVSGIGLLFAQNNTQAIMAACCYGFGGGVCVLPMLRLSTQWFSPNNIGKAISLTIGGALSGSIFSRLAHQYFHIDATINKNSNVLMHNEQSSLPIVITLIMLCLIFIFSLLFIKEKKQLILEHTCSIKKFTKLFCISSVLKEN